MTLIDRARVLALSVTPQDHWYVVDDQRVDESSNSAGYCCSCDGDGLTCEHIIAVLLYRRNGTGGRADGLSEAVGAVPLPSDDWWTDFAPLPAWVKQIRPMQWEAVKEIVKAYDGGADVVVLDAPTGSGKTLIAELVRRVLKARAVYVCSDKNLQQQFLTDFDYAALLQGRANYATQYGEWPRFSAADCVGNECVLCEGAQECPYQHAKLIAQSSRLAVLNTAYLLTAANYTNSFVDNELVIIDECDMLESVLMGFVEFRITDRLCKQLRVEPPKKGVHKPTIRTWLLEELVPAIGERLGGLPHDAENAKEATRLGQLREQAKRVALHLDEGGDNWIRDNDAGPLVMRPVTVGGFGAKMVWKYAARWLLMSASVISTDELADSLGAGAAGLTVETVTVPMTFPVENRPIYIAPVVEMSARTKAQGAWVTMAQAVENVCARHPDERVLVHCVSYELAKYLNDHFAGLDGGALGRVGKTRAKFTYTQSRDKAGQLDLWRHTFAGVMFAPSLDRGVDLRDDDCRVQIIAKVPFPYLGDPQVSARLHTRAGELWYATQTVRTLVQMTGRAVRSDADHAETYILDSAFVKNIWRSRKMLFPRWWREAVDMTFNAKELMR